MEMKLKQILVLSGIACLYILVFIFYVLNPFTDALEDISRIFALIGLLSLILSSIMAAFTREVYQVFGKPFKKVHHFIALFGLSLIVLHPVFLAISSGKANIFLPDFSSWLAFWKFAGRPAFYLIILAVLAGFLQKHIKKWWRYIHALNYIAVVFGVIHGILVGANLSSSIGLQIIFIALLVLTTASFILKRYNNYMRNKRIKSKQENRSKDEETVSD